MQPIVVLDRLQDAGNVGAILRSAAAFGFTQVLALEGQGGPVVAQGAARRHGRALRAAPGRRAAAEDALAALTVPLLATSSHAAQTLHEVALPWPCAWVIGHEGQGVCGGAAWHAASETLRIPQPGGEESLNVAAAAAVCLYESARQRTPRS